MSWFGETFGDSLNSLKGQITKITKEVLADEESANTEGAESNISLVKELEALCESKDLEIANLREELSQLHQQCKLETEFHKNQNLKTEDNCDISHSKDQQIGLLKNEIVELKEERYRLNSCIDELQSEHQVNLDQVISMKDKTKRELEELKKEYYSLKTKLDEVLKNQEKNENVDGFTKQIENKNTEICLLNSKIKSLQLQLEDYEKEKGALINEKQANDALKQKLEKLLCDIETISNDKQKTEEIVKKIQAENEQLRNMLNIKDQESKEIEIKFKIMLNEQEELLKKCQSQGDIESKLVDLLQACKIDTKEKVNESNIVSYLTMIENEWRTHQKERQYANDNVKEVSHKFELEVKKLKEENECLQNELKKSTEKWTETEKIYQEEINGLKKIISEMKTQRQDCMNQSQTDDVKRLEQEVAQFMNLILTKNNEIKDYSKCISDLEQEVRNLKSSSFVVEQELFTINKEKKKLEEEVEQLRSRDSELNQEKIHLEEKLKTAESENFELQKSNGELIINKNELEKQVTELSGTSGETEALRAELERIHISKSEMEAFCAELEKANFDLKNEFELFKAQMIIKESNLAELMKSNTVFQEEVNKLQSQYNELLSADKELKKWKDASVDLEIQRQDLIARKEELENECLRLKSELELSAVKDNEISNLKQANSNLLESCNQLHYELESKIQSEHLRLTKETNLEETNQKQLGLISELQEENNELKSRIQKFQEQMKIQMVHSQNQQSSKDEVQQHRRSKSAVDIETTQLTEVQKAGNTSEAEITLLKQAIQQEQTKYRLLQNQFQEISDKEASARKEFERLRQHLIEMEDHYTEEAVENDKIIQDLKSKLIGAEEQLQNSSTLYTSMKVRDNQHLESLQSQIRLLSAQRDDFQAKFSAAEDEVQKHKASLMSLQIVLEQFQQDKEREVEGVAMKYEKQLQLTHVRFRDLEAEIEGLKKQLSEAKNGLKAASRLGEQLEKKTQQVIDLEGNLTLLKNRMIELENSLTVANQSVNEKIDKSLIKNLVVGYILSPNTDRKSQVLRIMASVLDFDRDERNKMGVDSSGSGWLSNILHPKSGAAPSGQSLSEAFIRFLENESRPQPQLKFLPEQFESKPAKASKPTSTSPQPSGRFSELTLPTFNSSQELESSIILKSVLKDS